MDYLLANLPLIRSQKINGSAIKGDLKYPMIATQDGAREAVERLVRRNFTGHQDRMLLGTEDVSMREATRGLASLLGLPELPYIQFPPADMKEAADAVHEEAHGLGADEITEVKEGT